MKLFISSLPIESTGDLTPPDTSVPVGAASVSIVSDETFVANEPAQSARWYGRASMKVMADGNWIVAYQNAKSHIDTSESVTMVKFSDDYGQTWTAENTYLDGSPVVGAPIYPPGGSTSDAEGTVEGDIIVMPNGDLICSMWKARFGVSNSGSWHSRSTDNGKTWSTPTLVDYQNKPVGMDNSEVFMTDDDFIVGNTIYVGARWHTTAPSESAGVSIFCKSTDSGITWEYVSSLNTVANAQIEYGMEYVGNNTIVAHGRGVDGTGITDSALFISTDMGLTWSRTEPANLQVLGRQRIKTRSHLKGTSDWWQDPVLISHGFEQEAPPASHPRRWGIWVSKDSGATWGTVQHLRISGWDGGYGDWLWNPILQHYVTINYYAPTSYYDGYLRIVKWKLIWS